MEIDENKLRLFANGSLDSEETLLVENALKCSPTLRGRLDKIIENDQDWVRIRKVWDSNFKDISSAAQETILLGANAKYVIGEFIGEGATGEVWMATKVGDPTSTYAVKLIKNGATLADIARFNVERDALLALKGEPSIVLILDSGTTKNGMPFIVMEFVAQSLAITKYCDQHRLPLQKRLTLFVQLCKAVQFAHNYGIMHRDLKPNNILVAEGTNGDATVKIIDFGLAKAFDKQAALSPKPLTADSGYLMGTLPYLSPEQATLTSNVSKLTDVYSLGVVLYELLTGTTPILVERYKDKPLELLNAIVKDDPPRPSSRVKAIADENLQFIRPSAKDTRTLVRESNARARALQGDLDAIVMKAIEKTPSNRYENVSDLEGDIERYFRHVPVVARRQTQFYSLQKFARKHPALSFGGTVAFLVLLAALTVTTLSLRQALAQSARATAEATRAQKAEREAQAQSTIANEEKCRALRAEQEANTRSEELLALTEFQKEQLSGIIVPKLGLQLRDLLVDQLRSAVKNEKLSDDDQLLRVAEFEESLSRTNFVDLALGTLRKGVFENTDRAIRERYGEKNPVFAARMLTTLGETTHRLGLLEFAERPLIDALDIRRRELGNRHEDTIRSVSNLARLLQDNGKLKAAETLFREALDACRSEYGDEDAKTLEVINDLGALHHALNRIQLAEELLQNGLKSSRLRLGDEHSTTLSLINNLAALRQSQKRRKEAQELFTEALNVRRRQGGIGDSDTLTSINNLAGLLSMLGENEEAQNLLKEAVAAGTKYLGDEHPTSLQLKRNLAFELQKTKQFQQYENLVDEVLATCRNTLGSDHPLTLSSEIGRATFLVSQRRFDEAVLLLRENVVKTRRSFPENHPRTISAVFELGKCMSAMGRNSDAEELMREALRLDLTTPQAVTIITQLFLIMKEEGKTADVELLFKQVVDAHRAKFGKDHADTLTLINRLAACYDVLGKNVEAEQYYRESLEGCRKEKGNDNEETLVAASNLGFFLQRNNALEESDALLREALMGLRKLFPEEHRFVLETQKRLARLALKRGRNADVIKNLEPLLKRGDVRVINDLSIAYLRSAKPEEVSRVIDEVSKSLQLPENANPDKASLGLLFLARALNDTGAHEQAAVKARMAIQLATNAGIADWRVPVLRSTLTVALLESSQLDEAKLQFESGLEELKKKRDSIPLDLRDDVFAEIEKLRAAL